MKRSLKNRGIKIIYFVSTVIFVAVEILLGIALQKCGGDLPRVCSMLSVVLACAFFLLFMERTKDYILTQAALVLTICADYFLVWLNPRIEEPAMLFFLAVQLFYMGRILLMTEGVRARRIQLLCHFVFSLLMVFATAAVLGANCDFLAMISMVYYANLALNIVFAFGCFKKNPLLALGLLLFICCDTCVGIAMLDGYMAFSKDSLLYRMLHPGFDLVWAFYLPSQMLLALSLLPKRLKG